jgi:hypothetical protein
MKWLRKMLFKDEDKLMQEMQEALEKSNKNVERLTQQVTMLQEPSTKTYHETASSVHQEELEDERDMLPQTRHNKDEERFVSDWILGYLDGFNVKGNRFSIVNNIEKLSNQDDLMFKIMEMIKLSREELDFVTVYKKCVIRIDIFAYGDNLEYSVNSGHIMNQESIGITFLKNFISDIQLDILNFPCAKNRRIFEVKGKNYRYVLASSEKECRSIMKDPDRQFSVKLVDEVDQHAYVKSVKSKLIYSPLMGE